MSIKRKHVIEYPDHQIKFERSKQRENNHDLI